MSYKEVSRKAVALFFNRHANKGEHGYPKKSQKYYFITKNSVPRGYIAVENQRLGLVIKSIFVRPEDRRKGYGSKLIGYISGYTVGIFVDSYSETEPFFNACGMYADLLVDSHSPGKRMLSK